MSSEGTDKEVEILVGQGLEHYGSGELDMAIAAWEEALSLRPDNREAREYVEYVRGHYAELQTQFEDGSSAFRFTAEMDSGFALDEEAPTIQGVSFSRPSTMAGPSKVPEVDEGWFLGSDTKASGEGPSEDTVRILPPRAPREKQPAPIAVTSLDDAFDLGALDEPPVAQAQEGELRFTMAEADESGTLELDSLGDDDPYAREAPTVHDGPVLLTNVKPAVPKVNFNVVRIADSIDRAIDLADPLEADGGPVVEMTADADEDFASAHNAHRAETREDIYRAETRELSPLQMPIDETVEPAPSGPPRIVQRPTADLSERVLSLAASQTPTAELRHPAHTLSTTEKPTAELREPSTAPAESQKPTAELGPEAAPMTLDIELPTASPSPPPRDFERLATPEPQGGTMPMEAVARDLLAELDVGAPADEEPDDMIRRRVNGLLERAFQAQADGHHSTAVVAADLALSEAPEAAVAQKLLHQKERDLIALLRDYLGDPAATPSMAISMQELMSSQIDSRSAFLVSRVDGVLSFDELVDVSGMPRLEVHRHLCRLVMQGILKVM